MIGYSDMISGLWLTMTLFQIPNGVTVKDGDCTFFIKNIREVLQV